MPWPTAVICTRTRGGLANRLPLAIAQEYDGPTHHHRRLASRPARASSCIFFRLQERQELTRLAGSSEPPLARLSTWSITVAMPPQYWQVQLSRFRIAALVRCHARPPAAPYRRLANGLWSAGRARCLPCSGHGLNRQHPGCEHGEAGLRGVMRSPSRCHPERTKSTVLSLPLLSFRARLVEGVRVRPFLYFAYFRRCPSVALSCGAPRPQGDARPVGTPINYQEHGLWVGQERAHQLIEAACRQWGSPDC